MRFALITDPEPLVPPHIYVGIECTIDLLAREMSRRSHEVTLIAHPDSATAAELIPWPGRSSRSCTDAARNAYSLLRGTLETIRPGSLFSLIAYLLLRADSKS